MEANVRGAPQIKSYVPLCFPAEDTAQFCVFSDRLRLGGEEGLFLRALSITWQEEKKRLAAKAIKQYKQTQSVLGAGVVECRASCAALEEALVSQRDPTQRDASLNTTQHGLNAEDGKLASVGR